MEFISTGVNYTLALGKKLGEIVKSGDVICLTGDLGAGKTHFTKGLAEGLKITDPITSPTFTILNEYEGRLKLFHFDVYRVNDPEEITLLGFDEYIFDHGVSVIEWANYIEPILPEEYLNVEITKCNNNPEERKITMTPVGQRYNYVEEISL